MNGEMTTNNKSLKIVLSVLIAIAIIIGICILIVSLTAGNNNGVKVENGVTEYKAVNEDGEEVIVRQWATHPENPTKPSPTGGSDLSEDELVDEEEDSESDLNDETENDSIED